MLLPLIFLLSALGQSAHGSTYGITDLEVLANEQSYDEFFSHALDILPSQRQEKWKTMVVKMAEGFALKVAQKNIPEKSEFEQIETLYDWHVLKSDDLFKLSRNQIGLKYLRACLKTENPCWDQVKKFWDKDKSDPETALQLAQFSLEFSKSPLPTWGFLEVSLKSPLSEFYCKKKFVMEALWGKIEIDYVKLGPEGDLMVKIDKTIHPDCLPILVQEAKTRLYAPPKLFDRELAFQILKSQSKADQSITDFFFAVYLLDNPSQGELFNYSWNRVRELGGTVSRRENVIEQLKKLDPLPDSILGSLDTKKRRVVLNHFKTYFPEYMDYYMNQCLSFYGGKGKFPSGNPTIHCQDFMSSDLAPAIIDDFKIKEYQNIRKI